MVKFGISRAYPNGSKRLNLRACRQYRTLVRNLILDDRSAVHAGGPLNMSPRITVARDTKYAQTIQAIEVVAAVSIRSRQHGIAVKLRGGRPRRLARYVSHDFENALKPESILAEVSVGGQPFRHFVVGADRNNGNLRESSPNDAKKFKP